jgi:hypothetical protein
MTTIGTEWRYVLVRLETGVVVRLSGSPSLSKETPAI